MRHAAAEGLGLRRVQSAIIEREPRAIETERGPYLLELPLQRAAPGMACKLAELYFGSEILKASNLSGRDGRSALDLDVMDTIKMDIRRRFGQRIAPDHDFRFIWKNCREEICSKCKHLR